MRKVTRLLKRMLALFIVLLLSIESFGAVVSDNDGSAFITKAEFDSLKNNFQSQIDQYNTSIDSKIDGAIASYLAGLQVTKTGEDNVLSDGVYWSIGPFDRPRWQMGKCLYDFIGGRTCWNSSYSTSILRWYWRWTKALDNKYPLVNPGWGYRDIIVNNINSDNNGAKFMGTFDDCVHWWRAWNFYLYESGSDTPTMNVAEWWYGGLSGQCSWDDVDYIQCLDWRPQNTTTSVNANPRLSFKHGDGNVNQVSLYKGSKLFWDDKVSVFAPLAYNCFQFERMNENVNGNCPILQETRDEKCYITIDKNAYNSLPYGSDNRTTENWLVEHVPFWDNADRDPFNLATGTSSDEFDFTFYYARREANGTYYNRIGTNNLFIPYRAIAGTTARSNCTWKRNNIRIPDVPFAALSNWNQLGVSLDSTTLKTINNDHYDSALITDSTNTKLLSLAAGLPVAILSSNQKATFTGTFRENCHWYQNASGVNTLDEGTKDATNAYVVYAKLSPFDLNTYPENESDLIDISPETKDSANVGKLSKCLIVRDGDIKFDILNEFSKDNIVFIKWEKLSNWQDIGTTRKTGSGIDTDNRGGTDNTSYLAPPNWTYFGGGYLKLDDTYKWEIEG